MKKLTLTIMNLILLSIFVVPVTGYANSSVPKTFTLETMNFGNGLFLEDGATPGNVHLNQNVPSVEDCALLVGVAGISPAETYFPKDCQRLVTQSPWQFHNQTLYLSTPLADQQVMEEYRASIKPTTVQMDSPSGMGIPSFHHAQEVNVTRLDPGNVREASKEDMSTLGSTSGKCYSGCLQVSITNKVLSFLESLGSMGGAGLLLLGGWIFSMKFGLALGFLGGKVWSFLWSSVNILVFGMLSMTF